MMWLHLLRPLVTAAATTTSSQYHYQPVLMCPGTTVDMWARLPVEVHYESPYGRQYKVIIHGFILCPDNKTKWDDKAVPCGYVSHVLTCHLCCEQKMASC